MSNSAFSLNSLKAFTCSEELFRHFLNKRLVYTEGVQYLAGSAKCYWLMTDIAVKYFPALLKKHRDRFYLINFIAYSDGPGLISIEDGNDKIHLTDKISYTDFPEKDVSIKLYLVDGGDHYCLMLPSEY